jgi:hypothetical protein
MHGSCATYTILNVYCSELEPLNEQVCYSLVFVSCPQRFGMPDWVTLAATTWIFSFGKMIDSDSEASWQDPEPQEMDQDVPNFLTPPPSPTGSDYIPDDEPSQHTAPPAPSSMERPPQTTTSRPSRIASKPLGFKYGYLASLQHSQKQAQHALPALSQIGTHSLLTRAATPLPFPTLLSHSPIKRH